MTCCAETLFMAVPILGSRKDFLSPLLTAINHQLSSSYSCYKTHIYTHIYNGIKDIITENVLVCYSFLGNLQNTPTCTPLPPTTPHLHTPSLQRPLDAPKHSRTRTCDAISTRSPSTSTSATSQRNRRQTPRTVSVPISKTRDTRIGFTTQYVRGRESLWNVGR